MISCGPHLRKAVAVESRETLARPGLAIKQRLLESLEDSVLPEGSKLSTLRAP